MNAPNTLLEAIQYFADEDVALAIVADMRWPDGEQDCPKCGSIAKQYFMKTRKRWKCRDCRHQFSIKVGTIFEGSPLSLSLWLPAMWMLANCKNGISSYELSRALGVTQKTAWFMLHRIRLAMKDDGFFGKLGGDVVSIEPFHITSYLDEQAFRFNTRGDNDRGRFLSVVSAIRDKHLTYSELTGAEACQT